MRTGKVLGAWGVGCLLTAAAAACGGEAHRLGEDSSATGNGGNGAVGGGSGGEGTVVDASDPAVKYGWPEPPTSPPSAVDLLFVVDNSISMADKQQLLREAVPQLVRRLITPNCLEGGAVVGISNALGQCERGTPEFAAVTDLHLGVISSSLGSHGGQVCDYDENRPALNDRAHLLGSVREGLPSSNGHGFLAWDGTSGGDPNELVQAFQDHVTAVGETGCGYEAPLEAWYRFLVDPEPYESLETVDGSVEKQGVDVTVLEQREAFLRPDSLVGIVVLSDENDCSIVDEGRGWLVGLQVNAGTAFQLPRATSACAVDPESECCRSCAENDDPVPGCTSLVEDPECAKGNLTSTEDSLNLRCFDQKRRFGLDLLYPVERYVEGLHSLTVPARDGTPVPNPLFAGRHPSRVFLAGVVGVPWQDLSDAASWTGDGLRLLSSPELVSEARWDVILGDPESGVLPTDPLMIASVDPRTGTHPLIGVAVAPTTSSNPQENPINGHEQAVTKRDDLQYACTFPLSEPRDCSIDPNACDCSVEDLDRNRPLCQPPGGGDAGTTQYFAKAYPGTRHLELLKAMGNRGLVGSVCPKIVDGSRVDPSYGYNPVSDAIIDQAAQVLRVP